MPEPPLERFLCDRCQAQLRMLKPLQRATCPHNAVSITMDRSGRRILQFKNGLKQTLTSTADDMRWR